MVGIPFLIVISSPYVIWFGIGVTIGMSAYAVVFQKDSIWRYVRWPLVGTVAALLLFLITIY